MDEIFEVGEVAIFWRPEHPKHGCEVTILSPLMFVSWMRDALTGEYTEGMRYEVQWPENDGCRHCVKPTSLRKKRPPEEERNWGQEYWDRYVNDTEWVDPTPVTADV